MDARAANLFAADYLSRHARNVYKLFGTSKVKICKVSRPISAFDEFFTDYTIPDKPLSDSTQKNPL